MKSIYPLLICIALFAALKTHAQINLLINGGAEAGPPSTTGWTAVNSGSACYNGSGWRVAGVQNGFPKAEEGTYLFYPGCGGTGEGETYELKQDVNVSTYAASIDANNFYITFSGYTQSYNQSTPDATDIIVEYRDTSNNTVLASYNTGVATNLNAWVNYTDTRNVPVGTRYIRVRLISTSNNGSSIDGYFDNISLIIPSGLPVTITRFITDVKNKKINLNWNLENEDGIIDYTIQRSITGHSDFISIGTVTAKKLRSYYFTDNTAKVNQTYYYRLVIRENTNALSYSAVATAIITSGNRIVVVYPNPSKGDITLKVIGYKGTAKLTLLNSIGQVVINESEIVDDNTSVIFNLAAYSKGIYWLKVETLDEQYVEKVMLY